MTFIDKDGSEVKLAVNEGDNLLDIAQANDLEMEGEFPASTLTPNTLFPLSPKHLLTMNTQAPAEDPAPARPAT